MKVTEQPTCIVVSRNSGGACGRQSQILHDEGVALEQSGIVPATHGVGSAQGDVGQRGVFTVPHKAADIVSSGAIAATGEIAAVDREVGHVEVHDLGVRDVSEQPDVILRGARHQGGGHSGDLNVGDRKPSSIEYSAERKAIGADPGGGESIEIEICCEGIVLSAVDVPQLKDDLHIIEVLRSRNLKGVAFGAAPARKKACDCRQSVIRVLPLQGGVTSVVVRTRSVGRGFSPERRKIEIPCGNKPSVLKLCGGHGRHAAAAVARNEICTGC